MVNVSLVVAGDGQRAEATLVGASATCLIQVPLSGSGGPRNEAIGVRATSPPCASSVAVTAYNPCIEDINYMLKVMWGLPIQVAAAPHDLAGRVRGAPGEEIGWTYNTISCYSSHDSHQRRKTTTTEKT